jgi:hypothetical protein
MKRSCPSPHRGSRRLHWDQRAVQRRGADEISLTPLVHLGWRVSTISSGVALAVRLILCAVPTLIRSRGGVSGEGDTMSPVGLTGTSGLPTNTPSGSGPPSGPHSTKGGVHETFRSRCAAALLLSALAMASPLTAAPAFAADSVSTLHAARAAWQYYSTYPDYDSCSAAGQSNPQGRNWQCVESSRPGAFDLYLWS